MEKVEIDGEKIHGIMSSMDEEGRKIFRKLLLIVSSKSPLKSINDWLDNFEDDCPIDNLIARLVAQVIHNVNDKIWEAIDESKKNSDTYFTGHEAGIIGIAQMRRIADELEKATTEQCWHCENKEKTH